MYICVSTLKKTAVGEPLVLEKDYQFGEIAAKSMAGGVIGFAMHSQPEGCPAFFEALKNIGAKRLAARVVMTAEGAAVLYSDAAAV
ncbi:MAG: hypothetical protein FWE84_00500 [Firmicutes bacterium]|nr:hypothetical protein [Bacillota bacterium]